MSSSRVALLWLAAILITLATASWQRRTGPTYPVRGAVTLGGEETRYRLIRSQNTGETLPVRIRAGAEVGGELVWRRYPTDEPWQTLPLVREGEELVAALPTLPAAGKLEYRVRLARGASSAEIPAKPAVARFKGAVPAGVLVPHIAAMFLGMLFSNAAALSALARRDQARNQAWVAFALLTVGGLALGPVVQKYAFDAYWTGWPFGHDLTDNKTAVVVAAWAFALWRCRAGKLARGAIVAAALVTMIVFSIPHSLFGSEIKWQ